MKLIKSFVFFFLLVSYLHAYEGEEEVEEVFSQIIDLTQPTLQEYRLIEHFLQFGKRPYLAPLDPQKIAEGSSTTNVVKRRTGRNLKLVGDNGEMPIFEIHSLGQENLNQRCILLYSSYNHPYPERVSKILEELKQKGFQGDVLLRIGGYPNMNNGGIKLCHIPYSWKVAFFHEAKELGYKEILWIDTSIHPLKNLDEIFAMINQKGYLFLDSGLNLSYGYQFGHHLKEAIEALNVPIRSIDQIPHLVTQVLGFNVNSTSSVKILDEWLSETKKVTPCMNWYPEELCFSIVAWRNQAKPLMHWGLLTCNQLNYHQRDFFPSWNFFMEPTIK